MLRRLQVLLVLAVWVMTVPASAQDPVDEFTSEDQQPADDVPEEASPEEASSEEASSETPTSEEPTDAGTSRAGWSAQTSTEPSAPPPAEQGKPVEEPEGWETFVTGYFRAPVAVGISNRAGPDDSDGPARTQLSYGPNRTIDSSYFSFAYTRLQETDWAEVLVHAKKKHVHAVVGWMGYWFQTVGFRNPDASWVPGMAYVTLDTDFRVGGIEPNIALTAGAWWPSFGYFEKYDTYTLGRFRQIGEQLKLTIPFNPDFTLTLVQGLGTSRDGSFIYQPETIPPIYGARTGLDLIHYENVQVKYKEYVDVGLHLNSQWTRDPNLFISTTQGRAYTQAREAQMTIVGGEANLRAPIAGRLWVSPSYIGVRNGWALAEAGTEVMHSLSAEGFGANYLAWDQSPINSTASGSSLNLGFLYENTLSNILGKTPGVTPEVTLNVFGLLANASLDLPDGSAIPQDSIKQFKYGADLELQALDWLGIMLRYDTVNYDLDNPGFIFSAITPRLTFSSHFLSGESIYIQYSRYRYGDLMVLAGRWPWGLPLVAGSDIIQGGSYAGHKPDLDVVKLQANVAF
jgi:hypothetical protein